MYVIIAVLLIILPIPAVMKTFYLILSFATLPLASFCQSVINGYAEVVGVSGNTITVSNVDEAYDSFEDGEQVIIMQMQDNVIGNTGNNVNFGNIGSLQSVGFYEIRTIASHTENGLGNPVNFTFDTPLTNTYNTGTNTTVQIISFPELGAPNYTTSSDLVPKAWNGTTGGIVAFQVMGQLTLANNIIADGNGFRGAQSDVNATCGGNVCESAVYRSQWTTRALKGEGIYKNTNPNYEAARGRMLSGGGGGSCHNGAGGGGSNYSSGGDGGQGYGCRNSTLEAGGFGGLALGPYTSMGRIFMGGGGGAGERNNGHNTAGGNGGGIIMVKATEVVTAGGCGNLIISANGESTPSIGNDGVGGAGAGGTIIFDVNQWNISGSCTLNFEARGGDGGSSMNGAIHGGGGGGGQGAIIYPDAFPLSNATYVTAPGNGGCGNNSFPCNEIAGSGGGPANGGILGPGSSPLPVDLIYFTAELVDQEVIFGWQTAFEQHSDYYVIERLNEWGEWIEIFTQDAVGNSTSLNTYEGIDYHPIVGDNYYRLGQYDEDGSVKYYDPKKIYVDVYNLGDVVIYPNPSRGLINVQVADYVKIVEMRVFDVTGKFIAEIKTNDSPQNQFELDLSHLPKGIYFIQVNDEMNKIILTD